MNPNLQNTCENMLKLGLSALTHANWHANFFSPENNMWPQLSVLQAAHAAEILIKARIAQEHPLLIFDELPKSTQVQSKTLNFEHLVEKAKTIQYSDLPERLWAATGIKLKNLDIYKKFGYLRNCIQHFADPRGRDCSSETIEYIYKVIEPLINECWGLYAVDYSEDTEPYIYLIENLIRNDIEFLVPPDVLDDYISDIEFDWSKNINYKKIMCERFKKSGYKISGL